MSKKINYAEAVQEIDEIISKIENNEFSIDELSEKVKRISFLIGFCKDKLRNTELELNHILEQMQNE